MEFFFLQSLFVYWEFSQIKNSKNSWDVLHISIGTMAHSHLLERWGPFREAWEVTGQISVTFKNGPIRFPYYHWSQLVTLWRFLLLDFCVPCNYIWPPFLFKGSWSVWSDRMKIGRLVGFQDGSARFQVWNLARLRGFRLLSVLFSAVSVMTCQTAAEWLQTEWNAKIPPPQQSNTFITAQFGCYCQTPDDLWPLCFGLRSARRGGRANWLEPFWFNLSRRGLEPARYERSAPYSPPTHPPTPGESRIPHVGGQHRGRTKAPDTLMIAWKIVGPDWAIFFFLPKAREGIL